MYRQKKKKKPSLKFYLIISAAGLVLVAGVLLIIFGLKTPVEVKSGSLTFDEKFSGLIIRNEKVYVSENYGKAEFIAAEGQPVTMGTQIARVFRMGYNENNLSQLLTIQKEIKQYQENMIKDVTNSGLADVNSQIDAKTSEIMNVISGEKQGDLVALERELSKLMQSRMEVLSSSVNADDHLNKLYDDEKALEDKIAESSIELNADSPGIISFYFDGLEQVMRPENIDSFTISNVKDAVNGLDKKNTAKGDSEPLCRIVSPNDWNVLLFADAAVPEFQDGVEVTLIFDSSFGKEYAGTIVSGREDPKGYIYNIKVTDDIGDLLSARSVKAEVVKTFEGILVPASAVKEREGMKYVDVLGANGESKIEPVKTLMTKGDTTVVTPIAPDSVLVDGAQVVA